MASEENNAAATAPTDASQNDSNKQEAAEPLMAGPGGDQPAAPKPAVHKQNYEKDVIYLYQFSRTPMLPSLSPYCLKVETWLRLAGLKYEVSDSPELIFCRFRCRGLLRSHRNPDQVSLNPVRHPSRLEGTCIAPGYKGM